MLLVFTGLYNILRVSVKWRPKVEAQHWCLSELSQYTFIGKVELGIFNLELTVWKQTKVNAFAEMKNVWEITVYSPVTSF